MLLCGCDVILGMVLWVDGVGCSIVISFSGVGVRFVLMVDMCIIVFFLILFFKKLFFFYLQVVYGYCFGKGYYCLNR